MSLLLQLVSAAPKWPKNVTVQFATIWESKFCRCSNQDFSRRSSKFCVSFNLKAKYDLLSYYLSFCSVTESALDCTVHDVWNVALGWWNWTWHLSPYPSTPNTPTHPHKRIRTICQVAWHISFKAALKAFLLGVHLMKSALKALFPLADTSQPSEGSWPGKNKQRKTKRKHFL